MVQTRRQALRKCVTTKLGDSFLELKGKIPESVQFKNNVPDCYTKTLNASPVKLSSVIDSFRNSEHVSDSEYELKVPKKPSEKKDISVKEELSDFNLSITKTESSLAPRVIKKNFKKTRKTGLTKVESISVCTTLALVPPKRRFRSTKIVATQDIEDLASHYVPLPGFDKVWSSILTMRSARDAPVDLMGCDKLADLSAEPKIQRFHHLVAVFLSSQTTDRCTAAAMERLKAFGLTCDNISSAELDTLVDILRGVSFHKTKAKNLKLISEKLIREYDGDIPATYETLCQLPGIGPKMALIAMSSAWGKVQGIAVDVHVHRIANRLGWITTKTPEESCLALAKVIPRELWYEFNNVLVGFGQQRCKALKPMCSSCLVQEDCPFGRYNQLPQPFLALEKAKTIQ